MNDSYVVNQVLNGKTVIDSNVIRWKSNNRPLMPDATKELRDGGYITEHVKVATDRAREQELAEFLANYNHTPNDEEIAEMKANFEPGTTVVNVITGHKTHI